MAEKYPTDIIESLVRRCLADDTVTTHGQTADIPQTHSMPPVLPHSKDTNLHVSPKNRVTNINEFIKTVIEANIANDSECQHPGSQLRMSQRKNHPDVHAKVGTLVNANVQSGTVNNLQQNRRSFTRSIIRRILMEGANPSLVETGEQSTDPESEQTENSFVPDDRHLVNMDSDMSDCQDQSLQYTMVDGVQAINITPNEENLVDPCIIDTRPSSRGGAELVETGQEATVPEEVREVPVISSVFTLSENNFSKDEQWDLTLDDGNDSETISVDSVQVLSSSEKVSHDHSYCLTDDPPPVDINHNQDQYKDEQLESIPEFEQETNVIKADKDAPCHAFGLKPHKCTTCIMGFDHESLVDRHLTSEPFQASLNCQECIQGFGTRDELEEHLYRHVQFVCKICRLVFASARSLRDHYAYHRDEMKIAKEARHAKFSCEYCGRAFSSARTLCEHIASFDSEIFRAKGVRFSRLINEHWHSDRASNKSTGQEISRVGGETTESASEGEGFSTFSGQMHQHRHEKPRGKKIKRHVSNKKQQKLSKSSSSPWKCVKNGMYIEHTFKNQKMVPHSSPSSSSKRPVSGRNVQNKNSNEYKCSVCNHAFVSKGNYNRHKAFYANSNRQCREAYTSRLKTPTKIQLKRSGIVKPNNDDHLKGFAQAYTWNNTNERNGVVLIRKPKKRRRCKGSTKVVTKKRKPVVRYVCSFCSEEFDAAMDLLEHAQAHTDISVYQCTKCGESFRSSEEVADHKGKHLDEDHACDRCWKHFETSLLLKIHCCRDNRYGTRIQMLKKKESEGYLVCKICAYCTNCSIRMETHQAAHTGVKNYKCSICGQQRQTVDLLTLHVNEHMVGAVSADPPQEEEKPSVDKSVESTTKVDSQKEPTQDDGTEVKDLIPTLPQTSTSTETTTRPSLEVCADIVHTCKICERELGSWVDVLHHLQTHTGKDVYQCCDCAIRLEPFFKEQFCNDHPRDREYKCEICCETYKTHKFYYDHMRVHNKQANAAREDSLTCRSCCISFDSFQKLEEHHLIHGYKETYNCSLCGQAYKTLTLLVEHLKLEVNKDYHEQRVLQSLAEKPLTVMNGGFLKSSGHPAPIVLDKQDAASIIPWRPKDKKDNVQFICKFCRASFTEVQDFLEHVQRHTKIHFYKCFRCGQGFESRFELKKHTDEHEAMKETNKCETCCRQFIWRSVLDVHECKGSDTPPASSQNLMCQLCGSTHNNMAELEMHYREHTGIMNVYCTLCGCGFLHSGQLYSHVQEHMKEDQEGGLRVKEDVKDTNQFQGPGEGQSGGSKELGSYPCFFCEKVFKGVIGLLVHVQNHSGISLYNCVYCGMDFRHTRLWKRHKETRVIKHPYKTIHCSKSLLFESKFKSPGDVYETKGVSENQMKASKMKIPDQKPDKPYSCTLCGSTFHTIKTLKTHVLLHMDQSPTKGKQNKISGTELTITPPVATTSAFITDPPVKRERTYIFGHKNYSLTHKSENLNTHNKICNAASRVPGVSMNGLPQVLGPLKPKEVEAFLELLPMNRKPTKGKQNEISETELTNSQAVTTAPSSITNGPSQREGKYPFILKELSLAYKSENLNTQNGKVSNEELSLAYKSENLNTQNDKVSNEELRLAQKSVKRSTQNKKVGYKACHAAGLPVKPQKGEALVEEGKAGASKYGPYICTYCNQRFNSGLGLLCHVQDHTQISMFRCLKCGDGFRSLASLQEHVDAHDDRESYKCKICSKHFESKLLRAVHRCFWTKRLGYDDATQSDRKRMKFECSICGKGCKTTIDLREHHSSHTRVRNKQCTLCGRGFLRTPRLLAHIDLHMRRTNPDFSSVCHKKFIDFIILKGFHKKKKLNQKHSSPRRKKAAVGKNKKKEGIISRFFRCQVCSRLFTERARYIQHCALHSPGDTDKK